MTRFDVPRSPFWAPGMPPGEPYAALAETNTGQLVVPCGANGARAERIAEQWASLDGAPSNDADHRIVVGAVVVDPAGHAVATWQASVNGTVPIIGGPSRWEPIRRVAEDGTCSRCMVHRWAGCWMALSLDGCSECMPEGEAHDPRVWPPDAAEPRTLMQRVRRSAARRAPAPDETSGSTAGARRRLPVGATISPEQTRL